MSASGSLAVAISTLRTSLRALGLTVVTDPRNARPLSVLVGLPTVQVVNNHTNDTRVVLTVLAAPPGNQDASDYLISVADLIISSEISIVDARPGNLDEIPTYELTAVLAVHKSN